MFVFGLAASLLGNVIIGIGQSLQKYALNKLSLQQEHQLPSHASRKDLQKGLARFFQTTRSNQAAASIPSLKQETSPHFIGVWDRVTNPHWFLGILCCYVGEIGGNWLGMAYASAAVVMPMGIVAVFVNAVLAERWLGEQITTKQWRGYQFILVGVLLVLLGAPKGLGQPRPDSLLAVLSLEEWSWFMLHSWYLLYILLAYLLAFGIYTKVLQNEGRTSQLSVMSHLLLYVLVGSLIGGSTVLSSKAITVLLGTFSPSPTPAAVREVSAVMRYVIPAVVACILVVSVVNQEILKQKALSRFNVSQLQPIGYAGFNVVSILASVIVFREIEATTTAWTIFLSLFMSGIILVAYGSSQLSPSDDVERSKHV